MSEESPVTAAPDTGSGETAGQMLRKAREASGLHVAALAVAMKVPVKKLEALESDRFADLPDAVFVRALAASVCRALKVDAAPILAKLPASAAPRIAQHDQGVHMPTPGQGLFHDAAVGAMLKKPAVLAVVALLAGALAMAFWPSSSTQPTDDSASTASTAVMPPTPTPTPPEDVPQSAAVTGANGAGLPPMVAPAPVAAVSEPAGAPNAAAAGAASSDAVVSFKASASAWVRVSDSQGAVVFEKTLAAGETAGASGALPLAVVLGNAEATTVEVRGQPFALDTVSKNNVARFEVK